MMIAEKPLMKPSADGGEMFCLFWGQGSPFSNWRAGSFEIDRFEYSSGEQRMMHAKACFFGQEGVADRVMATVGPWNQKQLGRSISNYDEEAWAAARFEMMVELVHAKALHDPEVRAFLESTGDATIVEASPHDPVWGIGLSAQDPRAVDRSQWLGQNLLGQAWTVARGLLAQGLPAPRSECSRRVEAMADAVEARELARARAPG